MNIKGNGSPSTRKNQKERTKRTLKYRFKIRILIKNQNPNFKIRILIKNVFYKRYIISKDYKRQFKSVKTRGYKVRQNGITKCVRLVDYKVCQQWITKCVRCWVIKCGKMDYKVRQGLQSVAGWIIESIRNYKMWRDYKVS